ncbi:hypothetical protein HY990_04215 [Candidatus Micrarchaeota archaeon]|nr:hypothetical protein [Candidatus Micrarchaeota archaeon]
MALNLAERYNDYMSGRAQKKAAVAGIDAERYKGRLEAQNTLANRPNEQEAQKFKVNFKEFVRGVVSGNSVLRDVFSSDEFTKALAVPPAGTNLPLPAPLEEVSGSHMDAYATARRSLIKILSSNGQFTESDLTDQVLDVLIFTAVGNPDYWKDAAHWSSSTLPKPPEAFMAAIFQYACAQGSSRSGAIDPGAVLFEVTHELTTKSGTATAAKVRDSKLMEPSLLEQYVYLVAEFSRKLISDEFKASALKSESEKSGVDLSTYNHTYKDKDGNDVTKTLDNCDSCQVAQWVAVTSRTTKDTQLLGVLGRVNAASQIFDDAVVAKLPGVGDLAKEVPGSLSIPELASPVVEAAAEFTRVIGTYEARSNTALEKHGATVAVTADDIATLRTELAKTRGSSAATELTDIVTLLENSKTTPVNFTSLKERVAKVVKEHGYAHAANARVVLDNFANKSILDSGSDLLSGLPAVLQSVPLKLRDFMKAHYLSVASAKVSEGKVDHTFMDKVGEWFAERLGAPLHPRSFWDSVRDSVDAVFFTFPKYLASTRIGSVFMLKAFPILNLYHVRKNDKGVYEILSDGREVLTLIDPAQEKVTVRSFFNGVVSFFPITWRAFKARLAVSDRNYTLGGFASAALPLAWWIPLAVAFHINYAVEFNPRFAINAEAPLVHVSIVDTHRRRTVTNNNYDPRVARTMQTLHAGTFRALYGVTTPENVTFLKTPQNEGALQALQDLTTGRKVTLTERPMPDLDNLRADSACKVGRSATQIECETWQVRSSVLEVPYRAVPQFNDALVAELVRRNLHTYNDVMAALPSLHAGGFVLNTNEAVAFRVLGLPVTTVFNNRAVSVFDTPSVRNWALKIVHTIMVNERVAFITPYLHRAAASAFIRPEARLAFFAGLGGNSPVPGFLTKLTEAANANRAADAPPLAVDQTPVDSTVFETVFQSFMPEPSSVSGLRTPANLIQLVRDLANTDTAPEVVARRNTALRTMEALLISAPDFASKVQAAVVAVSVRGVNDRTDVNLTTDLVAAGAMTASTGADTSATVNLPASNYRSEWVEDTAAESLRAGFQRRFRVNNADTLHTLETQPELVAFLDEYLGEPRGGYTLNVGSNDADHPVERFVTELSNEISSAVGSASGPARSAIVNRVLNGHRPDVAGSIHGAADVTINVYFNHAQSSLDEAGQPVERPAGTGNAPHAATFTPWVSAPVAGAPREFTAIFPPPRPTDLVSDVVTHAVDTSFVRSRPAGAAAFVDLALRNVQALSAASATRPAATGRRGAVASPTATPTAAQIAAVRVTDNSRVGAWRAIMLPVYTSLNSNPTTRAGAGPGIRQLETAGIVFSARSNFTASSGGQIHVAFPPAPTPAQVNALVGFFLTNM